MEFDVVDLSTDTVPRALVERALHRVEAIRKEAQFDTTFVVPDLMGVILLLREALE